MDEREAGADEQPTTTIGPADTAAGDTTAEAAGAGDVPGGADPGGGSAGAGVPDAATPAKRAYWPLFLVGLVAVAAVALAAWGMIGRDAARKDLDAARDRIDALAQQGSDADDRVGELKDEVAKVRKENSALEKKVEDLEAAAEEASEDAAAEDAVDAVAFSAGDEDILTDKARDAVEQAASADYASCATITLVGSSSDGSYAIMHADLATKCSPNKADPGEFMYHRSSSGAWESVDPAVDAMVICGQSSSASAEVKAAIAEICP